MRGKEGGPFSQFNRWLTGTTAVPGADPFVFAHPDKNTLLLLQSGNNHSITIREFEEPSDIENRKKGKPTKLWAPGRSKNGFELWAPEAHQLGKKFYIPYTASDGENENHRMYVLESEGANPMGPYHPAATEKDRDGRIFDKENDHFAIDMTYLQLNDELYAIYSGWDGPDEQFPQNLYIARMKNPWTIAGERQLLKRPKFPWEKSVKPVVEGPQILQHDGRTFLTYSADASWSQAYKLGMMELTGDDPMDRASWTQLEDPIFNKGGTGHASFVETNKGEHIIFFHKKLRPDDGWSDRVLKQETFHFDRISGLPVFKAAPATEIVSFPDLNLPIPTGFHRIAS